MTSSKLSGRRGTAKRPSICVPPPPPPITWPPATFPIDVEIRFVTMGGPQIETWSGVVGPPAPPWHYQTEYPGELVIRVTFTPNPTTHLADLDIDGVSPKFGPFDLLKLAIPITWNSSNIYVVTSWDFITPGLTYAKAAFTF